MLNQDFQDFELIIIDDGSTYGFQNPIVHYAEKHEDKIVYIRHSNRGQSQSINRGILNSVGEYITILDSDDAYKPWHLSSCLKEINTFDLIASTTETVVNKVDDYYVPDKNNQNHLVHVDDCILFATLFGRREVFTSIAFRNGFAADADFYEKANAKFNVKKVDLRTYIYYRNMPDSICSTIKRQNLSD
ncbi:MAG: glycosyltransferase [Sphingobacteriales bacterium JAD_PAG50586_3]|nr:MAG: glycosyltransferase [Sphingobacteriales bacterium JAD_PAG50586_3]